MNIVLYIISGIAGYLIGNFSAAIFYSKLFAHEDIRQQGSGNAGAANMLRNYGTKMGIVTFLTDFLKGALAVMAGRLIGGAALGEVCGCIAGVAVVLGHVFPAFLKFKGGKGVSAAIGVMFTFTWEATIIIFIVCVACIFITGYVSVASMIGFVSAPFAIAFVNRGHMDMIIATAIISLVVIFSHRGNILRLMRGEERKARFTKKGERGEKRNLK